MVKSLDQGIGHVLKALDASGLRENTLVIFTSDNGGEQYSDMGPFTGHKMALWEGGIRVPAMMRWPGIIQAGSETDQVVVSMDWTATMLAAAEAEPVPNYPLDGMNLLPISSGEAPTQPRTLWWRTFQRTDHHALREGDWKFLKDGEAEYLFNLADDPGEQHDVKEVQSDLFQQLKRKFAAVASEMLEPVPLDLGQP
jgi:arylsulfatase A-like enzyme